ncbi:kinase-like protein, partial [Ceratobasidium sp. AG-I]
IQHTARELNAWSKLTHPNVAECLGLAVFRDQLVMISPWMDQGNVVEFLKRRPEVDRHTLSLQLTDAVVYLHEINVVHGDLKGANVLVANDGTLKLADFGLTIVQDAILEISITNLGGGTERWMASSFIIAHIRGRTDIYISQRRQSYLLNLEIFTGCPPFRNLQRGLAVVTAVGQGRTPERPKEISIYLRQADLFWGFLEKCWKRHPAERPTARQLGLWFREIV